MAKKMSSLGYALLLSSIFTSCVVQQTKTEFPQNEWSLSTPEEQGIDSQKMHEALAYLETACLHDGIKEVMIIRNGMAIYQGSQIDSVHNIWSCSKTFTSTVLGLLIDDGKISLDDTAAVYEPILRDRYSGITFKHFTTMTSGYSAVGSSQWPQNTYADWSWTVYEPDQPYFKPGTAYAYWDEAQMMFGRTLTQVLQQPMEEYLKAKVTNRIGMEWTWGTEKDIDGLIINNGCTGVTLNAKNLARWGLLFLNNGKWQGEQLISEAWIKQATTVQVPATLPMGETDRKDVVGPGYYGFNWWVNGRNEKGELKLPGAPEGCYFATDNNNNKCIVIPEWNMVIVRMGQDGNIEHADDVYGTFLKKMGEAFL